jgi:peptidyl-prolyl cis-trans isomerase B (cyclophilin B)
MGANSRSAAITAPVDGDPGSCKHPRMRTPPIGALLLSLLAGACNGSSSPAVVPDAATDSAPAAPAGPDTALDAIRAQIDAAHVDKSQATWRTSLAKPTPVAFTSGRRYFWTLSTSKGVLRLQLDPAAAPMHVTSTMYLTLLGFYDGLTFHRIVKGWVAQGGDPTGTGTGGPGYSYGVETSPAARHNARGVLSMAHAGPNTEGSQFFITFGPAPNLDGTFSAFGRLVEGLDTLAAIEQVGTTGEGMPGLVTIDKATVSVE